MAARAAGSGVAPERGESIWVWTCRRPSVASGHSKIRRDGEPRNIRYLFTQVAPSPFDRPVVSVTQRPGDHHAEPLPAVARDHIELRCSAYVRAYGRLDSYGHGRARTVRSSPGPTLSTSAGRCRVASIRATRCTLIRHRVRAGKRTRSRSPAVPAPALPSPRYAPMPALGLQSGWPRSSGQILRWAP